MLVQLQSWTQIKAGRTTVLPAFGILKDMKEKTDVSFGIVPVRKTGDGWEVLLINQYSKIGNNTYWVFPKGHAEGSESALETARRELKEETGLEAKQIIESPTFSLQYSFNYDGELIKKTVTFYIGIIEEMELKIDEAEVKEAQWCSLERAMERLDYRDTKDLFFQVKQYLVSPKMSGY